MEKFWTLIHDGAVQHPKPEISFAYGTAGFRMKAELLDSVLYRMGILAVLRSKAKQGKSIGVVITASHNPIQDNGVKLVDPMGEMLEQEWETYATDLANAADSDITSCIKTVIEKTRLDETQPSHVIIARDTRPSSESLMLSLKEGITAAGSRYDDYGVLTTPQLHYIVCCKNMGGHYDQPNENGYYIKFASAFRKARELTGGGRSELLKIDGANGVGALKVRELLKVMNDLLPVEIYNDGSTGELNRDCGADFVKVKQCAPQGLPLAVGDRCLSFDGDADRVVYFYKTREGSFVLLDGDKIATLIAGYIKEKLDKASIKLCTGLGLVQTAYANGSSTAYVKEQMNVPVAMAKTGVKYLHHKALEYDIGVYFEANGHGTVIYSAHAEQKIREAAHNSSGDPERQKAAQLLEAFLDMTNQTVGDAISDMLLVETILYEKQWSCAEWNKQYTDLPNRQVKVSVADRRVIHTNEDETRVVSPARLQEEIDRLVSTWTKARSFVRPSGTEDVVRVYAESENQKVTDHLAGLVAGLVYDICGGVGSRPDVTPLA